MTFKKNDLLIQSLDCAIHAAKMKKGRLNKDLKEAMKPYLDTWVVKRLECIRGMLVGEKDAMDLLTLYD